MIRARALGALFFLLLSGLPFSAHAVELIYSNDVMGEIEPCGCRENPLGGLVRKAGFLRKIGTETALLQLDAGNLFFDTDIIPEALEAQRGVQAQYLLKGLELLGHDAFTPGEKDFALGTSFLEKLLKGSKIKALAANLKRKNGKALFPASFVFIKKDPVAGAKALRIAVIGLVDPKGRWPKDLKASEPLAAARAEIKRLRPKVDLIVLLTNLGLEGDAKLAEQLAGKITRVDAIVGGRTQSFLQLPPKHGDALIFQSSFRNQYVGRLPLRTPLTLEGHELTGLDPAFEDVKDQPPSEMTKLVAEFKVKVAEVNQREQGKLGMLGTLKGAHAAKYQTWPRCAECHLKQFDFWRKTHHADALRPLAEKNQAMNKDCLKCHSVGLGDPQGYQSVNDLARTRGDDETPAEPIAMDDLVPFMKSVHEAKNLETPVKLRRADAEALPLARAITRAGHVWATVQCENCHKPGEQHPFEEGYVKTVARETCLQCHTPDQAPKWYKDGGKEPDWSVIDSKRKSITCPAGDL